MAECTIFERLPRGTTGKICLKSPPKTITFPPNTSFELPYLDITSLSVLSSASNVCLCAIGASSQIISLVCLSRSPTSSLYSILQVELSSVGTGILNFECAVRPPGNNNDVIPLVATVRHISCFDLNVVASVLHMYVLPVPP